MSIIPINTKVVAQLDKLIADSNEIAKAYNNAIAVLRLQLDVPEDYILTDVHIGFEPPKEKEQGA